MFGSIKSSLKSFSKQYANEHDDEPLKEPSDTPIPQKDSRSCRCYKKAGKNVCDCHHVHHIYHTKDERPPGPRGSQQHHEDRFDRNHQHRDHQHRDHDRDSFRQGRYNRRSSEPQRYSGYHGNNNDDHSFHGNNDDDHDFGISSRRSHARHAQSSYSPRVSHLNEKSWKNKKYQRSYHDDDDYSHHNTVRPWHYKKAQLGYGHSSYRSQKYSPSLASQKYRGSQLSFDDDKTYYSYRRNGHDHGDHNHVNYRRNHGNYKRRHSNYGYTKSPSRRDYIRREMFGTEN